MIFERALHGLFNLLGTNRLSQDDREDMALNNEAQVWAENQREVLAENQIRDVLGLYGQVERLNDLEVGRSIDLVLPAPAGGSGLEFDPTEAPPHHFSLKKCLLPLAEACEILTDRDDAALTFDDAGRMVVYELERDASDFDPKDPGYLWSKGRFTRAAKTTPPVALVR